VKVETVNGFRFYVTSFGRLPSVTTILSLVPKPALERWRDRLGEEADKISAEAAVVGSVCHFRILNKLSIRQLDPPAIFLPWKDSLEWLEELNYRAEIAEQMWHDLTANIDLTPLYVEHTLISRKHRFAGTLDLLARIYGKNVLIDLKTSKELWETYKLQLGAYYLLCEENNINVDMGMLVKLHPFEPISSGTVWLSRKELENYGKEFLVLVDEFYRQLNSSSGE